MLPLIIKNREAAIVASNIFLSCFFKGGETMRVKVRSV